MNIFSVREIIEFAVEIEKNGERFYRYAAGKFSDEKLKSLFLTLADEEVEHRKKFEGFLEKVENSAPPEAFNEEYFQYLKVFADGKIFNKILPEIKKPVDAIQFALNAERDSILYYLEAKNFVLSDEKNIIDEIIEQERQHFVKLSHMKF
ncbi:MAG: ferritin family protein [Elusimicrobiota bacterium]